VVVEGRWLEPGNRQRHVVRSVEGQRRDLNNERNESGAAGAVRSRNASPRAFENRAADAHSPKPYHRYKRPPTAYRDEIWQRRTAENDVWRGRGTEKPRPPWRVQKNQVSRPSQNSAAACKRPYQHAQRRPACSTAYNARQNAVCKGVVCVCVRVCACAQERLSPAVVSSLPRNEKRQKPETHGGVARNEESVGRCPSLAHQIARENTR